MKIISVAESYLPESSGGAVYAYELAKRLGKLGVKTLILTRKFGAYRDKKIRNVDILRIDVPEYKAAGGSLTISRIMFVKEVLKKIMSLHKDYDVIHVHSGFASQLVAWTLKKILRIKTPVIMTLHGTFIGNWKLLYPFPISKIYDTIERGLTTTPDCDRYFAVDDGSGAEDVLLKGGVDKSKIKSHFHAVDTEKFKPFRLKKKGRFIVYLGRLDPFKGVDRLIKAFKTVSQQFSDATFIICGDGPLRKDLETLTKNLDLSSKVKFLGNIPHKKVPYYVNLSDVFVYTDIRAKKHRTGLSLSMCEALSCGALCLFSYYPRKEWKIQAWIPLREYEPEKIAEKITDILNNPRKYSIIRSNAREVAVKNFSWDKIVKLYFNEFMKLKSGK